MAGSIKQHLISKRKSVFSVGKGLPVAQKSQELKKQMAAGLATFVCPTAPLAHYAAGC